MAAPFASVRKPKTNPQRAKMIGAVHMAAKRHGLEDDGYRDMLRAVTGKDSCRALSTAEIGRVLNHLNGGRRGNRAAGSVPQAGKVRALWISGYCLGVVKDRSDEALRSFVKRQTGIEAERWLRDPADARAVIEALKSWLTREAGVNWSDHGNPRACVVRAQWRRLCGLGILYDTRREALDEHLGNELKDLGDRELDEAIRRLGEWLRRELMPGGRE